MSKLHSKKMNHKDWKRVLKRSQYVLLKVGIDEGYYLLKLVLFALLLSTTSNIPRRALNLSLGIK